FAPINVKMLSALSVSRPPSPDSPPITDVADVTSGESSASHVTIAAPARARTAGMNTRWRSATQWFGGVGAIVPFVLLMRFALGIMIVTRLVRRARLIDSGDWTQAVLESARRVSVATVPRLVMSDQVETAFAFDALAPAIVLPVSAEEWPNARRRAV